MTASTLVPRPGFSRGFGIASVLLFSACDPPSRRSVDLPRSAVATADSPVEDAVETTSSEPLPQRRGAGVVTPVQHEVPLPHFLGRFDLRDPLGPKASWPGSRIRARFEGSAVSVTLREFVEPWMGGAPSAWSVTVDGTPGPTLMMNPDGTPHTYVLASNLPEGPHDVELFKRSETQTGVTQFLGFDALGGRMLPPPARQSRRIEVIGDSQASGFGVELLDAPDLDCPGADHASAYQNFGKSWGFILGQRFDAEVHAIVYSGKGLVRNVWPSDTDTLPKYYPRANPNPAIADSAPLFDMSSWTPDVIVMSQGSVDFRVGAPVEDVKVAYRNFAIHTLRARSPNAHIVMAVLGMGGRGALDKVAHDVVTERAALGDDRFHVFVAKPYTRSEMTACNGHGGPSWHARIAGELSAAIGEFTGWD